jgi:hypothetical protein
MANSTPQNTKILVLAVAWYVLLGVLNKVNTCTFQMDEPSDCPYIGCTTFLDEMKKRHNYNADGIVWGYATQKNLWMDNLERNTMEYPIRPPLAFIYHLSPLSTQIGLIIKEYNPSKQCQYC